MHLPPTLLRRKKWSAFFISQPSFFHKADLRSSPFPASAEEADRESRNLQLFSVPFPATPPAAPEKEAERKMPFPASPLRTDESPFFPTFTVEIEKLG